MLVNNIPTLVTPLQLVNEIPAIIAEFRKLVNGIPTVITRLQRLVNEFRHFMPFLRC